MDNVYIISSGIPPSQITTAVHLPKFPGQNHALRGQQNSEFLGAQWSTVFCGQNGPSASCLKFCFWFFQHKCTVKRWGLPRRYAQKSQEEFVSKRYHITIVTPLRKDTPSIAIYCYIPISQTIFSSAKKNPKNNCDIIAIIYHLLAHAQCQVTCHKHTNISTWLWEKNQPRIFTSFYKLVSNRWQLNKHNVS